MRADEEAAAKKQAEADRLKAEQQRLDAQRAEAARLQKQKQEQEAESQRLLQQQSSQADPEMSRSFSSASPPRTLTTPPAKPQQAIGAKPSLGLNESQLQALTGKAKQTACKRYIQLMETDTLEKKMARSPDRANVPDGMSDDEFSYYYESCVPMQQGGKL